MECIEGSGQDQLRPLFIKDETGSDDPSYYYGNITLRIDIIYFTISIIYLVYAIILSERPGLCYERQKVRASEGYLFLLMAVTLVLTGLFG